MKINMPEKARQIVDSLIEHGFEAYIVGGCVRDFVLGKEPKDWDITTSATPNEVKDLFPRTIDTGIEHGTVTVMCGKEGYEVTTYRIDGKYEDHRRPTEVTFTASLTEDLKRRDFTINAMAYNDKEGIIDQFNGIEDLKNRVIRCVGNPSERFDEDALRILRAVRFSAQLGFTIEENTKKAIILQSVFLKDISAERIQVELTKMLVSNYPEKIKDAYEMGITAVVLPEFDEMMKTDQQNPYHIYNVGEHTIEVVKAIEPQPILRWAALLHDVAKPDTKTTDEEGIDHFICHQEVGITKAEEILRRMKLDNYTIEQVKRLVKWHDYGISKVPTKNSFRKTLSKMGIDLFEDYVKIKTADIMGQSEFNKYEKLDILDKLKDMYGEILEDKDCLTVKDLDINGKQLMELGVEQGPNMKVIFNELLKKVLEEPNLNQYDYLSKLVLQINKDLHE